MYSLVVATGLSDIDPQLWPGDVLARIAGYPAHRIGELPPWNWRCHPAKLGI
jgi:transposase